MLPLPVVRLYFLVRAYIAQYLCAIYAKVAPTRRAPLAGEAIDCMWLSEQLWRANLLSRERYIVEIKTHDWGHRGLVGCLLRVSSGALRNNTQTSWLTTTTTPPSPASS